MRDGDELPRLWWRQALISSGPSAYQALRSCRAELFIESKHQRYPASDVRLKKNDHPSQIPSPPPPFSPKEAVEPRCGVFGVVRHDGKDDVRSTINGIVKVPVKSCGYTQQRIKTDLFGHTQAIKADAKAVRTSCANAQVGWLDVVEQPQLNRLESGEFKRESEMSTSCSRDAGTVRQSITDHEHQPVEETANAERDWRRRMHKILTKEKRGSRPLKSLSWLLFSLP